MQNKTRSIKSGQLFKLNGDYTIGQKKIEIEILSKFKNKLLCAYEHGYKLYIIDEENFRSYEDSDSLESLSFKPIDIYKESIKISDRLKDAIWTPQGNIMYTTLTNNKEVVVISNLGEKSQKCSPLKEPEYLSVSKDEIYIIADTEKSVYRSIDEGKTWSLVFKSSENWYCKQVIKVIAKNCDDFWTREVSGFKSRLCVYSVYKNRSDGDVTCSRVINIPAITDDKEIDYLKSTLAYDGDKYIFLGDYTNKAVHVILVNGKYHCKMLSSDHLKSEPINMAIDTEHNILYVVYDEGVMHLFKIEIPEVGY